MKLLSHIEKFRLKSRFFFLLVWKKFKSFDKLNKSKVEIDMFAFDVFGSWVVVYENCGKAIRSLNMTRSLYCISLGK